MTITRTPPHLMNRDPAVIEIGGGRGRRRACDARAIIVSSSAERTVDRRDSVVVFGDQAGGPFSLSSTPPK